MSEVPQTAAHGPASERPLVHEALPPEPELGTGTQPGPPSAMQAAPAGERPRFIFFGVVAAISLLLDIASKAWAEIELTVRPSIVLVPDHLSFVLAYNKGGAWGLLQDQSEMVRLPFFLAVSVLAILFIVSLYGKLAAGQHALKWGLPLVLGGALGNLSDRITRASVIDFIDYRADWVLAMNHGIAKLVKGWNPTDHWPTFNVADISICVGVGLMAVDMFTSRRGHPVHAGTPAATEEVAPAATEEVVSATPDNK